ncbi:hypothetical protein Tco_1237005 [Tanacetum coccineum]
MDPRTNRLQADPTRTESFFIGGSRGPDVKFGQVSKPTRDWALPWPVIDRFSQEAQGLCSCEASLRVEGLLSFYLSDLDAFHHFYLLPRAVTFLGFQFFEIQRIRPSASYSASSRTQAVQEMLLKRTSFPKGCFLESNYPECDVTVAEKDVAQRQPEKAKRKKLLKRSDPLPAKRLRTDHPSLASGTGGKSLASLRQSLPEGSLTLGASSPADIPTHVTVQSSRVADAPVYTAADIVTSSRGKTLVLPTSDVGGSSQPETSEESTD